MGEIRTATNSDLEQIKTWLKEELNQDNGFYYNFNIIEKHFNDNLLFVYSKNNSTIGFITGRLESPDIINIKKEFIGNGIGTQLYKYLEKKSKDKGICIIKVFCKPEKSISFWKKMGFEIIDNQRYNDYIKGFKILNYDLDTPNGKEIDVEMSSYTDEGLYNSNVEPNQNIIIKGVMKENIIYFEKRIIFPTYNFENSKDLVLKIKINDKEIFFDKAKREKGNKLGIIGDNYSYYIDKLNLQNN